MRLRVSGHGLSIEPLDNFDSVVDKIQRSGAVRMDWYYGSLFSSSTANSPPGRVFGLSKTHMLSIHGSADEEKLRFVVWCLSFLVGMRLTTTEAGFLDATPVKPRLLVDFFADEKNIVRGLGYALNFYDQCHNGNNPAINAKRYEAAIHALFLAQNPGNLPFETFSYLYMALDTSFSMMSDGQDLHIAHAERIKWMCGRSKIDTPTWAKSSAGKGKSSAVSILRNSAVHEAISMGEPLGFSVLDPSTFSGSDPTKILLEMRALTCRLLVFILDKQSGSSRIDYVGSPVDTRSTHDLSFC
ncbi:MAG: hypothetical protein IPG63_10140 [Xanthomonadales bacterium]|nr:hypothetical protein [Xanthomonadales bacterium]MBK7146001.1 hypothetical protein [Xanthomonadales bacterium]